MSEEKNTEQQPPAQSGEALSDESLEAVSGGLSLIGDNPVILGPRPLPPGLLLPTDPIVEPIDPNAPTIAIVV